MSWQLSAFSIVLVALGGAFWWYERSRPSARMLALVGTLAALAALGRDAFLALPDVKPTTVIVLVSGLAFGSGPGFAVGAIGALASNILLGQGPWTPWQMLGWGLVGVIGGMLGRAGGRRLNPLGLALACALAAEAYNLLLDLYTWVGVGSRTPQAFLVVLGQAAVFDATHVAASFLFALAFAPALLRILTRASGRLEVRWGPPASAPARARLQAAPGIATLAAAHRAEGAAAASAGPPAADAPAASASRPRVSRVALALIAAVAVPTLALGVARAGASSTGPSGAGPAASRAAPRALARASGGASSARYAIGRQLAYLAASQNADGGFGASPGASSTEIYTAWAALGLAAAGRSPARQRRGGHSVLDALRANARSLSGAGDLERTILALRASGASVHSLPGGDPVARLLAQRSRDGSFSALTNLTAFGVLALRAAGIPRGAAAVASAARWLVHRQNSDGGFGFAGAGGPSDVDDTAAVLQALTAAGVHSAAGSRALSYLLHAQNPDGGFPQSPGRSSNAQSSAWAIQGLLAAGRDPTTVTDAGSRSPVAYLESLTSPAGSVRYSRTGAQTPVWVTAQALTGLAEKPFPISPPASARGAAAGSTPSSSARAAGASRAPVASKAAPPAPATAPAPGAHAASAAAPGARVEGMARALGTLIGALAPAR